MLIIKTVIGLPEVVIQAVSCVREGSVLPCLLLHLHCLSCPLIDVIEILFRIAVVRVVLGGAINLIYFGLLQFVLLVE